MTRDIEAHAGDENGVGGLRFRRPTEADHPAVVKVVDEWWGGRRLHDLLPRLWFQHFSGTSWIAETADGSLAGFIVGFVSPDHPDVAHCHLVASNPNLRRRGVARSLYERFFADARALGARRVTAITWPGNRVSLNFHRALGFEVEAGPGTARIFGTPAFADYDGAGADRVVLVRRLDGD